VLSGGWTSISKLSISRLITPSSMTLPISSNSKKAQFQPTCDSSTLYAQTSHWKR
jgi:hypothetical protein